MGKPISSVQLGIARLGVEISDRHTDAELAAWVRSFHRALALQKPELNEYAAELLEDVEAYRKAESARKSKNHPQDSGGIPRKDADSEHSQSVSQSYRQTNSKTEKKNTGARFAPPSYQEVQAYCSERGNSVDPQRFIDHYTANGWRVGKNPMKDWRAAVRLWEKNDFSGGKNVRNGNAVTSHRNRKAEREFPENLVI